MWDSFTERMSHLQVSNLRKTELTNFVSDEIGWLIAKQNPKSEVWRGETILYKVHVDGKEMRRLHERAGFENFSAKASANCASGPGRECNGAATP